MFNKDKKLNIQQLSPNSEMEEFINKQLSESKICDELMQDQVSQLHPMIFDHRKAFASDKGPLGVVIVHEVDIKLNHTHLY